MQNTSNALPPLLITGAPGWLGDVLVQRLAAQNPPAFRVRCFVNSTLLVTQREAWRQAHPTVSEIAVGNLADRQSLEHACANLAGGAVVHAAGVIHPRGTSEWYAINRDGTLALAAAAKAGGARRFVYVSSNAAQGRSEDSQPLTEEMPCRPLSHYGRSKREAEEGLLRLHEPGRFEVVIARPCMFYGPPVPRRHVEIFQRIRRGRLPLVGGGNFQRSLSYIDDLIAGILLCLTHPRAPGEIFNLCDVRVYSTREVCDAMAAALGVEPKYIRLPSWSSSLAHTCDTALAACGIYSMPLHLLGEADWNVGCSSRKAIELLGFKPTVDVAEGYRRAVAWCKEKNCL